MKKLIFILLTTVTAATSVAAMAACNLGQTGGGDTTMSQSSDDAKSQRSGNMAEGTAEDVDGEFGFMPPDMPTGENVPMGENVHMGENMPLPPQGRIFNPMDRHPEILHKAPEGNFAPDGKMPIGKIGQKNDKRDMVTPDGNIMPETENVDITKDNAADGDTETAPDNGQDTPEKEKPEDGKEKPAPETKRSRNKKGDKRKRKPGNKANGYNGNN